VYTQNGSQGLALADVNITNLQNVQAELSNQHPDVSVEIFSVNVTDEKEIAAVVQFAAKFGRIDISIHTADITGAVAPTHEYPLEKIAVPSSLTLFMQLTFS
jgi:NAD(P)-dependent dehydrogenase (short-subunit alcohol dehydrogenase family)